MARYKDAINWIVDNDDTDFMHDEEPILSVTAVLVMDLWDKSEDQILRDIRAALILRNLEAKV
jgi:hypothetical protein